MFRIPGELIRDLRWNLGLRLTSWIPWRQRSNIGQSWSMPAPKGSDSETRHVPGFQRCPDEREKFLSVFLEKTLLGH
jgi:hypothetical protein